MVDIAPKKYLYDKAGTMFIYAGIYDALENEYNKLKLDYRDLQQKLNTYKKLVQDWKAQCAKERNRYDLLENEYYTLKGRLQKYER